MTRLHDIASLAALLLLGAPGMAQDGQANAPARTSAACAAPAILPEILASWTKPVPIDGGRNARGAQAAMLTPGRAVTMALHPTSEIAYSVAPARPAGSASYGGLAHFTVQQAGTWRVALGAGAWVDVIRGKDVLTSIAHGHGPECSGIRKMVDYSLKPGGYTLQIAGNGTDSLPLLVTRLP